MSSHKQMSKVGRCQLRDLAKTACDPTLDLPTLYGMDLNDA